MACDYENFEDLSREHEAFLAFLSREDGCVPGRLRKFAYLLEKIHHAKEENFLFPLLYGGGGANPSGPKCMTFFSPRVMGGGGWVDSFQSLKSVLAPKHPGLLRFDSIPPEYSASMIRVPMEDHRLGGVALQDLLLDPGLWEELYPRVKDHLRDHIQREEECLFELFRASLTAAQKKEYAGRAAAFDEEMSTAARLAEL